MRERERDVYKSRLLLREEMLLRIKKNRFLKEAGCRVYVITMDWKRNKNDLKWLARRRGESALVGSKKEEFDGIWPCKRSVGPWMCGHTWGSAERIGSALRECPALSVTRTKGVSVRELGQGLQTLCHCLREACMWAELRTRVGPLSWLPGMTLSAELCVARAERARESIVWAELVREAGSRHREHGRAC